MDVAPLMVDREVALKEWKRYQSHKHNQGSPLDLEISRIYKVIAAGKLVVDALAAIVRAGLGEDRLPKLAIVRADCDRCFLSTQSDGAATFLSGVRWENGRTAKDKVFKFPSGSFPGISRKDASAVTPHIPPDIRPRRGIQNYHVLFEAVWKNEPPVDPLLLRRMGDDVWLVCGAWELTPVERSVMQMHMQRRQ